MLGHGCTAFAAAGAPAWPAGCAEEHFPISLQTFIKPPEVLTRDRLLGMYEVKPTLARLKTTLLGTGGVLLLSSSLLFGLIRSQADGDGMYGEQPLHSCHAALRLFSLFICVFGCPLDSPNLSLPSRITWQH